jgi:predicted Rossmann fold flavoprotein
VGPRVHADVVVVGAGAAGLATAIFAARASPGADVRCLDGARHLGAKILVSGGSRCNVTNRLVDERDFWGGEARLIRRVLRAFPAARAADWFETLGVALHEEEGGKLFPNSNRARTVLEALLAEAQSAGVTIEGERRVVGLERTGGGFLVRAGDAVEYEARAVVLATGGRSLPKTGSDGGGYVLARALGHSLIETTPALAPLVLTGGHHASLAGVSHPAALTLRVNGERRITLEGSLLWTHFGISGPVVLNMSRHWHRARLHPLATVQLSIGLCPGETEGSLDRWLLEQARARPRARLVSLLTERVPAAVAEQWVRDAGQASDRTLVHLEKEERRRLVQRLLATPLDVTDSRGYGFAEATAGGVPLAEIDTATMASRVCPGLYLVGEILDVDGRLGGFNFQWAWSSAWVAGHGVARALAGTM